MPTFTFTSPQGKTYSVAGPEGATKEQAFQILQGQIGAKGDTAPLEKADQIPGTPPQPLFHPNVDALHQRQQQRMNDIKGLGYGTAAGLTGMAGAAAQLVPGTDVGDRIVNYSKGLEAQGNALSPSATRKGKIIPDLLPFLGATKIPEGASLISKALRSGATTGTIGAITSPVEPGTSGADFAAKKAKQFGEYALPGAAIPLVGGAAAKYGKPLLEKYSLGSGKAAEAGAEKLRSMFDKRMEGNAVQAAMAEKAAAKAERSAGLEARTLPGVKTVREGGAFKPIPTATTTVGDTIREKVGDNFKRLQDRRNLTADKNTKAMYEEAAAKGNDVTQVPAFKELLDQINKDIAITTDKPMLNQLTALRDALEGNGAPLKLESSEILRRKLGDAAYSTPAEGYGAISQARAKQYYKLLSQAQEDYVPSAKKYVADYREMSKPLDVSKTKLGEAFTATEGGGKGDYSKTPSATLATNSFKTPENFKILVDSLGGNKQQATSLARKYFASQMEGIKTTAELDRFMAKNRTMLEQTGSKKMVDTLYSRVAQDERRAGALKAYAPSAAETKQAQAQLASVRPEEVAKTLRSWVKQNQARIGPQKYAQFTKEIQAQEDLYRRSGDAKAFRAWTHRLLLGSGVLGYAYRRELYDRVRDITK